MGKQARLRAVRRAERRIAELQKLLRPTITLGHEAALKARERGDAGTAISLFESVAADAPSFLLARGSLADLLLRLGRWSEAERVAADVVKQGTRTNALQPPRFVSAARNHAEAVSVQGRDAEASDLFLFAAKLAERFIEEVRGEIDALTERYELELAAVLTSWATTATHMYENEIACEMLREARAIYVRCRTTRPDELADCLANLGAALWVAERPYEAELALREALDAVTPVADEPRAVQILGILGRMGSDYFDLVRDYARIARDAEAAEDSGRFSAAYVRLCICAEIAARTGDNTAALAAIEHAAMIEPRLDAADLNPAKLRIEHARALQRSGSPNLIVISKLMEGARLWFDRLARPFQRRDFAGLASEMHENFRLLSRMFLDVGRLQKSLLSFEAGRAVAHCTQVDPTFRERVVESNPFSGDASSIDLSVLRDVQASLADDEVLLSIAALPPEFVAFVITRDEVSTCRALIPPGEKAQRDFALDLEAIPTRLRERAGARAIPAPLHELSARIRDCVVSRRVVALIPYGTLHNVPWRAVLRNAGLCWSQLPARIEFGLLLRSRRRNSYSLTNVVALGHGMSGDIDLCDEARAFAREFGAHGSTIMSCSSSDFVRALQTDSVVLVSCHGDVDAPDRNLSNLDDGELILTLSDGAQRAKVLIPHDVTAPLVILSACESGVYRMRRGDFPIGAAPDLIRAGTQDCVGMRFPVLTHFAASFFPALGRELAAGTPIALAFAKTNEAHESKFDLWRDLACVELVGA